MRMHPFCLLLIIAVPALVTAATQTNCIIGCKCEQQGTRKLKVQECDRSLILSNKTLLGVPKMLTTITFNNVVIEKIEKDAFTGFDELELLSVEDSTMGSIDPQAFDLPELGQLSFTKTNFKEIPTLNSEYLEELIFNDCKLSHVPNLEYLPALSFLNLANNFIETIDESAFDKVTTLEEVTLSNNSISKLSPNLFSQHKDFNTLNLDYNPLKTFELTFVSDLELLSLRHCQLSTFDRSSLIKLSSLSSLDLSGNEISILPIDAFESMKNLNNLDLSNNKLVELDDDIFLENSRLDRIVLDNNQFESLPNFQTKDNTFRTYSFSCKNCNLKSVKGSFDNMKSLVSLDLSNNKIEDIEGAFSEMRALSMLLLSNNQISTVGINSFAKNSVLETLDLSNNPLVPLDPVVLASIQSLKKLNVSNCNLEKLWSNNNAKLPSLEQLYVKKNKLTVVDVKDVEIIPNLKVIDLQENPIVCTENLYELFDYLVEHDIFPGGGKTHEKLMVTAVGPSYPKRAWLSVLPEDCMWDNFDDDDDTDDDDDDTYVDDDDENELDDEDIEESEYSEDGKEDIDVASVLNPTGFNLAKASYILSITSVFILTALVVLFVAVMVTLLILKRNKSFNMHNGNLPRLKIPLWHTASGQKKHSGSIYRPLSEELSGSRTPIINRYDFKQTPQVHNSLP